MRTLLAALALILGVALSRLPAASRRARKRTPRSLRLPARRSAPPSAKPVPPTQLPRRRRPPRQPRRPRRRRLLRRRRPPRRRHRCPCRRPASFHTDTKTFHLTMTFGAVTEHRLRHHIRDCRRRRTWDLGGLPGPVRQPIGRHDNGVRLRRPGPLVSRGQRGQPGVLFLHRGRRLKLGTKTRSPRIGRSSPPLMSLSRSPRRSSVRLSKSLPMSLELKGEETVNDIETVHYQDSEETTAYEWLMGEASPEYTYDIWLAEIGNWPVKVIYDAECEMRWEIQRPQRPHHRR